MGRCADAAEDPDVLRRVERAVHGGDLGATGYTTVRQADHLVDLLHLPPGTRLLDLGTGSGWPGLYLTVRSGCRTVLADVPYGGLRHAVDRARVEGIGDALVAVSASGLELPFRAGSFDAVTHTDVLC